MDNLLHMMLIPVIAQTGRDPVHEYALEALLLNSADMQAQSSTH